MFFYLKLYSQKFSGLGKREFALVVVVVIVYTGVVHLARVLQIRLLCKSLLGAICRKAES